MHHHIKKIWVCILGTILISAYSANFAATVSTGSLSATPNVATNPNPVSKFFAGNFSGSADLTSNYVFRGISESNNDPAIQGSLTYSLQTTGIYVTAWGSTVNFLNDQGKRARIELDTSIGIANPIIDNANYDISLARYNYPNASAADYNELIVIGNYQFLEGTISYSSNVYNSHKTGIYYQLGLHYDVPAKYIYFQGINVSATVGHYNLPKSADLYSYSDYSATISKKISNYILSLGWTGTNGKAHEAPLDNDQIVGTVAVSF